MTAQTKVTITAVDQASGVLQGIGGNVGGLIGKVSSLQAAFAGLGAVGVLTGLATKVKEAIDAADAFDELSQKTGIAVKEISALDYAFRREGVTTEALGAAIKKLSGNMIEAQDATSKAGKLFREFGIDAKGSTQEALLTLADVFQKLPDGATKSALAVELLGKAGTDLIPAFNNGRAGIEELTKEAERLGLVINDKLAKDSATFNDNLFAIKESGKALGITLANQTLPALNDIVEAMNRGIQKGGLLTGVLDGLRAGFSRLVFGDQVQNAADEIGRLENLIADLERESVTASGGRLDAILNDISKLEVALKSAKALYDGLTTSAPKAPGVTPDKGLEDRIGKALSADKDKLKETASAYDAIAAAINKRRDEETLQLELGRTLNEAEKFRIQINEQLERSQSKLSIEQQKSLQIAADFAEQIIRENMARKEKLALFQSELDGEEAAIRSLERNQRIAFEVEVALKRSNEDRAFEISLIGKTAEEIELLRLARQREKDLLKAGNADQRARIELEYQQAEALVRTRQSLEQTAPVFANLRDVGANFFADLLTNGRLAFDNLRESLKRFASDLIATFAKRYILNLTANAGSGGGFSLSSLGSLFSSGGGFNPFAGTSNLGGLATIASASSFLGSTLAQAFGANAQGVRNAGIGGSFLGGIPGAIIGVLTGRSRENQNFRFTQGGGGDGLFGGLNAEGSYGFDLSALRNSTSGLDARILRLLGGDQTAGTAALAAYTAAGRRADGQPAQFAFPEGDSTAAEQIAKELLQSRYGTLFSLIDQKIAEQIKSFAGTSTELQQFIETTLSIFEAVSGSGIKGLNLDSLRELAGPNGDLAQTLAGISQNIGSLIDAFTSDEEKLSAARKVVSDAFNELGVSVPQTREQFLGLVKSIDLSTAAGRAMYDVLVRVAPAMQQIDQASQAMLQSFQTNLAAIFGNASNKASIEGQAVSLVVRLQQLTGLLGGVNPLDAFKGISGSNAGDVRYIFDNFGPEAAGVLNQILELYVQYMRLQEDLNESTGDLGLVMSNGGLAMQTFVDNLKNARDNLREYLVGSLANSSLSPLSVGQRFDVAKSEYNFLLDKARGGDADAVNKLGGARDQLLELGRLLFASSGEYNTLFATTFDELKAIASGPVPGWQTAFVSALPPTGQTLATSSDVQELTQAVTLLLKNIADGQAQGVQQAAAAADRIAREITAAQQTGGVFTG